MTEQQQHLSQALEQQGQLVIEINELNSQLSAKRELALKLQGIVEYLQQTGVTLPEQQLEEVENEEET